MKPDRLSAWTMPALLVLLCFAVLTLWINRFAAVGVFEFGIFSLGFAWSITACIKGSHAPSLPVVLLPLGAVAAWPLVQLAAGRTIYPWETWNSFWNWTVNWTVFFLAVQIASNFTRLRRFLKALLYFAGILTMVAVLQNFTSGGRIFWLFPSGYEDFVFGPFVYQNQFAAFVELVLPVGLYFALIGKSNRLLATVIAALMVVSVFAAASRAGAMLVTIEILLVPIMAVRAKIIARHQGLAAFGKIGVCVALGALVVGYSAVWKRFLLADPYVIRREVWMSALHMIRDRAGMGFGLGTWASAYPQYALFDPGMVVNQAHSDWLQWTVEGGIPYLLLMLIVAVLLSRAAVRSIWGIGVVFVLVHAMADYPFQQRPALAALVFAVAGAAVGADREG
jgi:O-antigen ligase